MSQATFTPCLIYHIVLAAMLLFQITFVFVFVVFSPIQLPYLLDILFSLPCFLLYIFAMFSDILKQLNRLDSSKQKPNEVYSYHIVKVDSMGESHRDTPEVVKRREFDTGRCISETMN